MRHNALVNQFTDLDEITRYYPPHVIIRAADVGSAWGDDALIHSSADLWMTQPVRRVIYEDESANKYYYELVPYVHPVGAGSLQLGTVAVAADGVVTYTPDFTGRLIAEAGTLVPTAGGPQDAIDVAGMLFSDYYTHFTDNAKQHETFRALTIEEGDFLWVVRRGEVYLDAGAAVTDGDILNTSDAVAGEVLPATAIDTTTAITLHATLIDHLWGPNFKAVAQAKETIVGAGQVLCWMNLPPRFSR